MRFLQSLAPALRGSLYVLLAAGFSGLIGPLLRLQYDQGLTPLTFAVWRGLVAGTTLWLAILWLRRQGRRQIVWRTLSGREQIGMVGFVVCNITLNTALFVAVNSIPIAVALLIFYTYPVLLAIYGRVSGTEAIGPVKLVALILGLVGLGLVVGTGSPAGGAPLDPFGVAMAVLAAVTGAAWVALGKSSHRVPADQAMAMALTSTVFVIGGVMLLNGELGAVTFPLGHPQTFVVVTAVSLLSGAVAAVVFTRGVRLISRVRAGVLGLIEPIVGAVSAAIILGQVLAPVQLLGGAFVLAAAALIQRDQADETAPTPTPAGAPATESTADGASVEVAPAIQ